MVRAVPFPGAAAAGVLAACIPNLVGSAYVLKKALVEPAIDTTITIGRYEWTVVRRTVAGVVTLDRQGETEGLLQNLYLCNTDYEHFGQWANGGEVGRVSSELMRAGVPVKELVTKVVEHLQGYTAVRLELLELLPLLCYRSRWDRVRSRLRSLRDLI